MTRKDFLALALALHHSRPAPHWDANKRTQWDMDVRAVAQVLDASNPNFDRGRFLEACGGLFQV